MRQLLLAGALLAGACKPSAPPEPAPYAVGEELRPADQATINMIDRYGEPVSIRLLDLAKAQEQGMRIESGQSVYCRMIAKAGRTDAKQCSRP